MTKSFVSKILKTINLVVGAIRPKRVTWKLDKSGIGYEKIEDEMNNNFEMGIQDNAIGFVRTKIETENVPELFLTDNGLPWIQSKKETESKSGINIQGTENPKITPEELRRETQTNLETIRSMQESIDFKSKIIKKPVNKSKNKVLDIVHCRYTPEELAREKSADIEARRRLQVMIESKFKEQEKNFLNKIRNDPIFNASMLGDGHIGKLSAKLLQNGKTDFSIKQKESNKGYLIWLKKYLKRNLGITSYLTQEEFKSRKNGRITYEWNLSTNLLSVFAELSSDWYRSDNPKKIVHKTRIPADFEKNFTPMLMSHWFQQDATCCHYKRGGSHIRFHSNTFTKKHFEKISKIIKIKFNIESQVRKKIEAGKNCWILEISHECKGKNVSRFLDLIKPFIRPEFKYKLVYPKLTLTPNKKPRDYKTDSKFREEKKFMASVNHARKRKQISKKQKEKWNLIKKKENKKIKKQYGSEPESQMIMIP